MKILSLKKTIERRFFLLSALKGISFGVLSWRLFDLQVIENKKYYRHTGYPGGIKETTPEKLHQKKPEEVLKLAVKRMLPGGPLGKKQLSKLKVY